MKTTLVFPFFTFAMKTRMVGLLFTMKTGGVFTRIFAWITWKMGVIFTILFTMGKLRPGGIFAMLFTVEVWKPGGTFTISGPGLKG